MTPMATFREFCDGVLDKMPRATRGEKADIRDELLDHLLEHRDMLMDHGYDELDAEQRAIAAMGDPEEIGRAWNEKLSPFWLWLGRVCILLVVLLVWNNFYSITGKVDRALAALEVRHAEDAGTRIDPLQGCDLLWAEDPGIEKSFGEHIIRIHRAELWHDPVWEDYYAVKLYFVTYHQDMLGKSLDMNAFRLMEFGGGEYKGGGSGETAYASWHDPEIQVERGQKTVRVTLDYHGSHFEAEVKLDWSALAEGGEPA